MKMDWDTEKNWHEDINLYVTYKYESLRFSRLFLSFQSCPKKIFFQIEETSIWFSLLTSFEILDFFKIFFCKRNKKIYGIEIIRDFREKFGLLLYRLIENKFEFRFTRKSLHLQSLFLEFIFFNKEKSFKKWL